MFRTRTTRLAFASGLIGLCFMLVFSLSAPCPALPDGRAFNVRGGVCHPSDGCNWGCYKPNNIRFYYYSLPPIVSYSIEFEHAQAQNTCLLAVPGQLKPLTDQQTQARIAPACQAECDESATSLCMDTTVAATNWQDIVAKINCITPAP